MNIKINNTVITKEKTDSLCMRISIGGFIEGSSYLVFRGDNLDSIEALLEETLIAFKEAKLKYNQQMN